MVYLSYCAPIWMSFKYVRTCLQKEKRRAKGRGGVASRGGEGEGEREGGGNKGRRAREGEKEREEGGKGERGIYIYCRIKNEVVIFGSVDDEVGCVFSRL